MTKSSRASLSIYRRRIDALDEQLVRSLNERAALAIAVGGIKVRLGMKAYVPGREREVLRNALDANTGPLSDALLRKLFRQVIAACRSTERSSMRRRGKKR
jgi:chorismate mutase/prephenate dehydratase